MIDFLKQLHHLVHFFKTKKLTIFVIFMFYHYQRTSSIAEEATSELDASVQLLEDSVLPL